MSLKVSIITPSFNQGAFIEQTIESVLSQDYENMEYIIIDGGSTDNTLEILRRYDNRVRWVSEPDNGQSDAINKGFRLATGDIVAWMNSDDTYEPGAISAIVPLFEKNPKLGLIYGEGYIINESGERVGRFSATVPFDLWKLIHVWDYILQPTTFFRRDALVKCGYLDERLNWAMDWDLWIRLAMEPKSEVLYIDRYLANSREYAETKTSTGGLARIKELRNLMCKYAGEAYAEGFWLYYYDWITKLGIKGDENITAPSMDFLHNLPIPDDLGYCPPTTNFNVRRGISEQLLYLSYEDEAPFEVNIFLNDYHAEKIVFEGAGRQEVVLDIQKFPSYGYVHHIRVEFSCNSDRDRPKLKAGLL